VTYQEYLSKIDLSDSKRAQIFGSDTIVLYEEVFQWKWFATKLKIFSFLTYSSEIDKQHIESYSGECLQYAIQNLKGLPKGWQNGVLSNNVLISELVTPDAIAYVTSTPAKHFAAIEMPVIFDLSSGNLHFYTDKLVWGSMYCSFIKGYLTDRFLV